MKPSLRYLLVLAATILASVLAEEPDSTEFYLQEYSWYKKYTPQPKDYCFYGGCWTGMTFTFNYPAAQEGYYYQSSCNNTLMIKSVWACGQKYCTREESEDGRRLLNAPCEQYARMSMPTIEDLWLSPEELAAIPILNATDAAASAGNPLNSPVIPDLALFDTGYRTIQTFYKNWDLGAVFAFSMVGFWSFVILVGIVFRVLEVLNKPFTHRETSWWLWTRRNVILPATFSKHQSEAIANTFTIPPRLETLVLTLFLIMNIAICFPGYVLWEGNLWYPDKKLQLARYIGDRTGYFSIGLLPMVWVFAARNNFLMWMTGWSFATFNRFHRWIARISVAHAIAHSIAWTMFEIITAEDYKMPKWSYYKLAYNDQYWWMGVIATVVMSTMIGASAWIVRERAYDLFLLLHIAMSVVFVATLWYHVQIFNGEFNYWLYCCIAVWVIDRALRFGRTLVVSILPHFTRGIKATATYDLSTEMIRLDITDFLSTKPVIPGLFYYLYMPGGLRGYESHPFTLCSWHRPDSSPPSSPVKLSLDDKVIEPEVSSNGYLPLPPNHIPGDLAHTLLIRPYRGMTCRLHKRLLANHEGVASIRQTIFLEGPYGQELDLSSYSDVLVICGGSGITAAISHSHYLLSKNDSTKVHIAWAVPQRNLPDDICANELASVVHTARVGMVVYLTDNAEKEAHNADNLPARPPYEIKLGRPDVGEIMREQRAQATSSLAIVTCGTPAMSDSCRQAVVRILAEDGVHVGYYNETMIW